MTSPPTPKNSRLGKGYSYLFAAVLTGLLVGQSLNISLKFNNSGFEKFDIATRELNGAIFYPCVALIAAILGLPTDAIALALGHFLSSEKLEQRLLQSKLFKDKERE
ncbi:hypothetical protein VF14_08830 [Nostoc linckia z18]|uniref:Uncharacterized protein n=2 Tax=Nostoc linckia TaxID=92942 RepID=A0A9Q5ZEJ7_NOSLI|nr:hypothetical protein [Nostoc linckia]PHK42550.1 hypothetical protein VF12_02475 [Nostoc linckia z15]PHK44524.1 hypothetical protein VF13_21175 [Nostoc linckia z16]PHJ59570.1 hypothetical protein VF02_24455 [Nostoc linckia z1]PHJ65152.1 hypothetical protein VF05_21695 [Nostoc linckia z3]PHJ69574.1 hypothetical protein VF03_23535 [Nostoc linckia z2]